MNEAFSASHRAHASLLGIKAFLPGSVNIASQLLRKKQEQEQEQQQQILLKQGSTGPDIVIAPPGMPVTFLHTHQEVSSASASASASDTGNDMNDRNDNNDNDKMYLPGPPQAFDSTSLSLAHPFPSGTHDQEGTGVAELCLAGWHFQAEYEALRGLIATVCLILSLSLNSKI